MATATRLVLLKVVSCDPLLGALHGLFPLRGGGPETGAACICCSDGAMGTRAHSLFLQENWKCALIYTSVNPSSHITNFVPKGSEDALQKHNKGTVESYGNLKVYILPYISGPRCAVKAYQFQNVLP